MSSRAVHPRLKDIWRVFLVVGRTRYGWEGNKFQPLLNECTNCRTCMTICSFFHEEICSPALARIRITSHEEEWSMRLWIDQPLVKRIICAQCPGVPPCMVACPVDGAMRRDERTGAVVIDNEKCPPKCRECAKVCPDEAIFYHEGLDKVLKCDLCDGDPQCVKWCPIEALKYEKVV